MTAKIFKMQAPTRRRKREVFPKPRRDKHDATISIRVSHETKARLLWIASQRRETLGTMMGLNAEMLGELGDELRYKLQNEPLPISNETFVVDMQLSLGELKIKEFPMEYFDINGKWSLRRLPDAYMRAFLEVHTELCKMWGYFRQTEIMQRDDPKLGCSITQALREGRIVEVRRLVKSWKRQAKKLGFSSNATPTI